MKNKGYAKLFCVGGGRAQIGYIMGDVQVAHM